MRYLIDPCSQASFVSNSLVERLRLKLEKVNVSITGTGSELVPATTKSARVCIKPHYKSDFSCDVDAYVLPKIPSYSPPSMKTILRLPYLNGLVLADSQYIDKGHIDVLLGATVYSRILEGTVIKGGLQ